MRLAKEIGSRKAAEQLGIPFYTLIDWRSARRQHGDKAYVGSGHSYPDANKSPRELELEKENAELRRANDILKDALGFFRQGSEEVKPRRLFGYIRTRQERWGCTGTVSCAARQRVGVLPQLESAKNKPKGSERLLIRIKEIFGLHPDNDNYGARRIHLALIQEGMIISYSTVYRVMKKNHLA